MPHTLHARWTLPAAALIALVAVVSPLARSEPPAPGDLRASHAELLRWQAQDAFYSARYGEAADLASRLRAIDPADLFSYEMRSLALLFQVKRHVSGDRARDDALGRCPPCADWVSGSHDDIRSGQMLARTVLEADPANEAALYFLGKLNLNFLWLELGISGRRTGWNEFWEARRSLDTLLRHNPQHIRGRVARAWMDYIVSSSLPRGTRWLLGGGNRMRSVKELRDLAGLEAPFFERAEVLFGLWDMERRERQVERAVSVAQVLARDFPANQELAAFLETIGGGSDPARPQTDGAPGCLRTSVPAGPC